MPWSELEDQVRDDLGFELDQVFAEFDTEPLAAASIARRLPGCGSPWNRPSSSSILIKAWAPRCASRLGSRPCSIRA
nr:AarF/UbiB family protein [Pseudomonas chlororaphis]